jgi:hypothetical protein
MSLHDLAQLVHRLRFAAVQSILRMPGGAMQSGRRVAIRGNLQKIEHVPVDDEVPLLSAPFARILIMFEKARELPVEEKVLLKRIFLAVRVYPLAQMEIADYEQAVSFEIWFHVPLPASPRGQSLLEA